MAYGLDREYVHDMALAQAFEHWQMTQLSPEGPN